MITDCLDTGKCVDRYRKSIAEYNWKKVYGFQILIQKCGLIIHSINCMRILEVNRFVRRENDRNVIKQSQEKRAINGNMEL